MALGGTRTVTLDPCADALEGQTRLADALERWTADRISDLAPHPFLRLEQPVAEGDPLAWLRQHPVLLRAFWHGRASDLEIAGVGVCVEHEGPPVAALDELLAQVASGDAVETARLFGTVRFDPLREAAPEWAPYGRSRFHLPLLEMRRSASGCVLACNLKAGVAAIEAGNYEAQRRTAVRALRGALPEPRVLPMGSPLAGSDEEHGWTASVESLLRHIEDGDVQKAVLARAAHHELGTPVDPIELFEALRRQQPDTCQFLVQPSPASAFLGASPEFLYRRVGRHVLSEALAGTRRRGSTPERDGALAGELLASEKDRREQEIVRQHLLKHLAPHCGHVEAPAEPDLRSVPMMHHLLTTVEGTLNPGVHDADLLSALHPTPAVCGTATAAARELLRKYEPFDRGLYAGPVGCFGREESEVAVAIRSALVQGSSVQVFAGAGIVAGSDPRAEWQETSLKMQAFDQLLDVRHAS
ncbi:MAG: isochorismate synthase [Planctomycetota bacterium]|nr:isochorismate synthase [Planctomycetota bacterium]